MFWAEVGQNKGVALTREKILDTALDVLRTYGLADLSMRRLASELSVAPGALYYHVKNKQELLASLATSLLDEVHLPAKDQQGAPEPSSSVTVLVGEALYQKLIPIRESSDVIRLALALPADSTDHPRLQILDELTETFARAGAPHPDIAAESLLHLTLSLIEQQHTQALLTGTPPPSTAPASFSYALAALTIGFTAPHPTFKK